MPFENPLDYETYDEFKWYVFPYEMLNSTIISVAINDKEKFGATIWRMKLLDTLVLSPKFSWNDITQEGRIHIKASIRFIGQNDLLKISANKILSEHTNKRDSALLESWNSIMSDPKNYQKVG